MFTDRLVPVVAQIAGTLWGIVPSAIILAMVFTVLEPVPRPGFPSGPHLVAQSRVSLPTFVISSSSRSSRRTCA